MTTLIAWFFLVWSSSDAPVVIAGPFKDQQQCEMIRQTLVRAQAITPCYSGPVVVGRK